RRRRKSTPFAHPQQKAAPRQHGEVESESVTGTGDRPEKHNQKEPTSCSERVGKPASSRIHQRVCEKERRLQVRELFVRERNVERDGFDRYRQGLPVQITDRNRSAYQNRNSPALHSSLPGFRCVCRVPRLA